MIQTAPAVQIPAPRSLMRKPSDVIFTMVRGLKSAYQDPYCAIDMSSYGEVDPVSSVCVGCAAAFTMRRVAKRTKTEFIPNGKERWEQLGTEWRRFEVVVDNLRQGYHDWLLNFYEVHNYEFEPPLLAREIKPAVPLVPLETDNWHRELWRYRVYRDQLKSIGF